MKRVFNDEDLQYLNRKLNKLWKKVRELEDLLFKWGNKYLELEELK